MLYRAVGVSQSGVRIAKEPLAPPALAWLGGITQFREVIWIKFVTTRP
jgi:hypothetical protein